MKIAVTATGKDLAAELDPRFGRASHFILVDPDTMDYEIVENLQNLNLAQGAGIQAAQTIAAHKADVLLTGNCGPKAFKVLEHAGVRIFTNVKGSIAEAVKRYLNGELTFARDANVEGHWV